MHINRNSWTLKQFTKGEFLISLLNFIFFNLCTSASWDEWCSDKNLPGCKKRLESKPLFNYSQEKSVDCLCKIDCFILNQSRYQTRSDAMPSFIDLFLFSCLHYRELSELLLVGLCKERADARSEGSSYKNKVRTYKSFLRTMHSSPALPTLQWEMRKQVVLLWVFRNKLRYQSWTEQLFNLITLHAAIT